MNLRTMTLADHPSLITFWKANYFVNEMDTKNQFKLFLDKNPDLSIVMETDGRIIGTALGSYDGRRGYIQKVVTAKEYRKRGIGKMLVLEVIRRLRAVGVLYIPLAEDKHLVAFYIECGFKKTEQVAMNMSWSTYTYTPDTA